MASSNASLIQPVLQLVDEINPGSILDVGAGMGIYGLLFRKHMDMWYERYHKPQWECRIDAVEVFSSFITPVHTFVYNNLYIKDFNEFVDEMESYDLVFMGAVLEHMEKEIGEQVIKKVLKRCRRLLITTPSYEMEQPPVYGNPHEEHKAFWKKKDFEVYNIEKYTQDETHIIVLLKGDLT